jgi:hypothetical protein
MLMLLRVHRVLAAIDNSHVALTPVQPAVLLSQYSVVAFSSHLYHSIDATIDMLYFSSAFFSPICSVYDNGMQVQHQYRETALLHRASTPAYCLQVTINYLLWQYAHALGGSSSAIAALSTCGAEDAWYGLVRQSDVIKNRLTSLTYFKSQ